MNTYGTVFHRPSSEIQDLQGIKGGSTRSVMQGQVDAATNKRKENATKLINITNRGNDILCKAKAVWPFDLFPDEVTVNPNQVNVSQRYFFNSETILSVPIKNIADILVECSLSFATIKIIDQAFKSDPITIKFLRKTDAMQLRRVVQGLIIAKNENLDVTGISHSDLMTQANTLGRAAGME